MYDTPTLVSKYLKENNANPLKRLSQNFLVDKNVIRKIVNSIDISQEDIILEIGPGIGALTHTIIKKTPYFIAVEKDKTFAKNLIGLFSENPKIQIYEDDFLTFPLEETLLPLIEKTGNKVKVIANLPYGITSPIISKLLQHHRLFSEMSLMVQYEMAQRLTSKAGSKDYGSFTIFTNFYADTSLLFKISPNCFYPKPKVNSALIGLKIKDTIPKDNLEFHKFVQKLFQKRRKTINSVLKETYNAENLQKALQSLSISQTARAESLKTTDLYNLFQKLKTL